MASELSLAEQNLKIDKKGNYLPVENNEKPNITYNPNSQKNDNITVAKNIPLNNDSYESLNDFNTLKGKIQPLCEHFVNFGCYSSENIELD